MTTQKKASNQKTKHVVQFAKTITGLMCKTAYPPMPELIEYCCDDLKKLHNDNVGPDDGMAIVLDRSDGLFYIVSGDHDVLLPNINNCPFCSHRLVSLDFKEFQSDCSAHCFNDCMRMSKNPRTCGPEVCPLKDQWKGVI